MPPPAPPDGKGKAPGPPVVLPATPRPATPAARPALVPPTIAGPLRPPTGTPAGAPIKPPMVPSIAPVAVRPPTTPAGAGRPPTLAKAPAAGLPARPPIAPPPRISAAAPPRVAPPPSPAPRAPSAPPPGVRGENLTQHQVAELDQLAAAMEGMDYFEILRLEKGAPPPQIKKAFYGWSRTYHPDKFYKAGDPALREKVNDVFKRVTEAYYVLKDDEKRTKYLADISGPERAQKLRFTEASEVETKVQKKKEQEEQIGTHPKGRQFFQTGMADFEAGRWSAAERNFKMALTYEPQNARYKEKLKESGDKQLEEQRASGSQFKIS